MSDVILEIRKWVKWFLTFGTVVSLASFWVKWMGCFSWFLLVWLHLRYFLTLLWSLTINIDFLIRTICQITTVGFSTVESSSSPKHIIFQILYCFQVHIIWELFSFKSYKISWVMDYSTTDTMWVLILKLRYATFAKIIQACWCAFNGNWFFVCNFIIILLLIPF